MSKQYKNDRNRLDKVAVIKQRFLLQTETAQADLFESLRKSESDIDCKDCRIYVVSLTYLYILLDYLKTDWAFMQYSFLDADYGIVTYDISDKMIDYIYNDGITALDILDAMIYRQPWYGPINDVFIDKYVLTTFHRLTSEMQQGESK